MPFFVQQTIFKLSTNKIYKYEGGAALGTLSQGDTAVRQAEGGTMKGWVEAQTAKHLAGW